MTVDAKNACIELMGNNTNKGYFFSFPIDDLTDIRVSTVDPDGIRVPLQNGTDYQVIMATPPITGGEIRFTGYTDYTPSRIFRIQRIEPIEQSFSFDEYERISPTEVENALDYRCRIEQQLECEISDLKKNALLAGQYPDLTNAPDGKILETKNNQMILVDHRVPLATGVPDGSILAAKSDKWTAATNIAVGRELPSGGTTGQHLTKKDNSDFSVDWTNPPTLLDLLPSLTGNAGKDLKVKQDETGTEWVKDVSGVPSGGTKGQVIVKNSSTDNDVSWKDQRMPDPSTVADGKTVVSQSGKWVESSAPTVLSDDQQIEDSSGMLTGYTVTNNGGNLVISACKIRFLVGGKRVEKDFPQTTIPAPISDGIYYVVAKVGGTITADTTRPQVDSPDEVTLSIINVASGSIRDIETEGTNLKGLSDQIKFLSGLIGGRMFNGNLVSSGKTALAIDSLVPGKVDLWRYGLNSNDLGQYNFGTWTFSNPINFRYENKDGALGAVESDIDFNALQYYDSTGALTNLARGKHTMMLVYIEPRVPNLFRLTYGLGEWDNHETRPSVLELSLIHI